MNFALAGKDAARIGSNSCRQSPTIDSEVQAASNDFTFGFTPTPEPASLTLLVTGIAAFSGFGIRRWRRSAATT
jgi:hypothetical protein